MMKKYKKFISKFSKGVNIEVLLNDYANSVEEVRNENLAIKNIKRALPLQTVTYCINI